MTELEIIGQNIRRWRSVKGWTQAELGSKVKLTKDAISRIELGRQNVRVQRLIFIQHALDVQLFQLVMEDSESKIIRLGIDEGNFKALKALLEELIRKLDVSKESR